MNTTETSAPIPTVPERITIVLKAQEGSTLERVCQFVSLGMPVSIGRGMAVIAGASDEDLQMVLGEERDDRQMQAELQQQALGAPAHLAAHAREMFDLLRRIDAKCGGLDAAIGHGIEPSEQMWAESREAMEAIWELQDKIQSAASVDAVPANTTTPPQGGVLGLKNGQVVTGPMHIDDRVKMVGGEPAFLTIVFKLPSLNDAKPLIDLLPYGQKAMGTEAEVYGFSTGNLMEDEPCAD